MSDFLERISKLSPKRLALLAAELNSNLERLRLQASEPLAIIGIGCRFPGGANEPESLWQLISEGRDAISEVPPDRWDINAYFDPDPDAPGKMSTRWGGFLSQIDQFDPEFFGISPREAAGMDPQQRLLLEVAWEAFEHAGQSPDRLAGSRTGVFVGLCNSDYYMMRHEGGTDSLDAYVATGNAHSVASGRISYLLGLQGPSVSVDTACSSSLVAVHLACQALRLGECRMALAGGVNVILAPNTTVTLSKSHMMSPVGRCKAFDASADGFVRAEGCGLIVVKRLPDARGDGDRVLAVIRGTALNQDGKSSGLTAPNGPSQVAVIQEALANAGLQPSDVDFIEAHGTGTSLGDPIEARALADVFGSGRASQHPLCVGSIKSNIGHAESAAGIAGLLKVVLALQHGKIPPSLHMKKLNPHIDWGGLAISVPNVETSWSRVKGLRIAGVSSFGFSGTNAHVVVSDAPITEPGLQTPFQEAPDAGVGLPLNLLPLSARSGAALAELARKYEEAFAARPGLDLAAVCHTAGFGRSHFEHRLAVLAADLAEAKEHLAAFRRAETNKRIRTGCCSSSSVPSVVFMFSGQGSQHPGMGQELFKTQPVFRRELEKCAEILKPLLDRPLLELLFGDTDSETRLLDQTQYTQPALFALEYALAGMWRSWGLEPVAVLGHSVGEYVAACVADVFSLEDGLRLIAERGRLMATLPPGGGMAAVFAEESRVAKAIAAYRSNVTIACINAPASMVISGNRADVDAVLAGMKKEGVESRPLAVSHAFHSPLMHSILEPFERVAKTIRFSEPRIAIVSNMTGKTAPPDLMTSAGYWSGHISNPVRFADSIRTLRESGQSVFLEIGPHRVLTGLACATAPEREVVWAASLSREKGNWESLLEAASTLYVRGVNFDWTALPTGKVREPVALPTYPFQRRRFWLEGSTTTRRRNAARLRSSGEPQHPLLGDRLDSPAIRGAVFEIQMGLDRPAFLNDHRIFGRLIMPSPAYIEMALAGAAELFQIGRSGTLPCEIAEFAIREPLFLPEKDFCRIQLVLDEPAESTARFQVCSYEPSGAAKNGMEGQWRTHATGQVRFRVSAERARTAAWNRDEILTRCSQEIDARAFYDSLIALGLDFGERFRGIASIRRRDGEALGEIRLPQALTKETSPYRIHPALLDSCLHLLGAALPSDAPQNAYLLIALECFRLYRFPPERFWNHTVVHRGTGSGWEVFTGDIWLYTDEGETIAEIKGLQLKRATGAKMACRSESEIEDWFYRIDWLEQGADSKTNEDATSVAAAFIPAPVTLAEKAGLELRALAESEKLAIYEESVPKLESLSFAFIMQALSRMGWVPRVGEEFATGELADRLGVVPVHRRLFARLMAILAEEGILNRAGDGWIVLKEIKPIDTDLAVQAASLAREFPDCSAEVTLTARCAQSLDEVIRGKCDPLQLLFPNGDFETADALYRRSPFARVLNSAVRHVLVAALQDAPRDRKVRILEIGAGTGGTTSFLLPHLSADRTRYAFTDVSPLFLARARDEFQTYPFVEFELLDIEKAPATQGFSGRTFDVVIAANALHATRDLREAVRNAVSPLAPGGLLILLEGTTPTRWVDLTFGLTDGWWRFGDTALRSDYALVSRKRWLSLLEEAGLECIGFGASEDGSDAGNQQTIFLGRKALSNDVKLIPANRGYWIVLADAEGISRELGALIEASGQECVLVQQGTEYKFTDGKLCLLNLLSADQFARLLSDASAGRSGPLHGIVNLWAVDEELTDSTTPAQWETAQARLGAGVLHAFQAFLSGESDGASTGARFWIATRGAQAVSPDSTPISTCQPMQALVWGLSRVISLEHPSRFGAVIDLDPGASPKESADAVWRELRGPGEDAIAYRHGRRLVPRVVRAQGPPPGVLTPHREASYLVTGGLGGLGLHIAHWLAERGAGHLVLLSRRDFPDRSAWSRLSSESEHHATAQRILGMEKLGARVIVAKGDVADEQAMRSLIAGFGRESPPLRGIVHAAVEMSSSLISELDLESFNRMCRAKALGGWILHQLTLESKLDFFVLFSSTTALWGVAGLGHYAAANQALDQLAQWRHGHGLPALSVNWGTWREMRVASKADQHRFEQAGLHPMPVERTLAALERLIASNQTSAIVASVDWNALRTVYEMRRPRPLFAQLSTQTRTESGTNLKSKSGAVESKVGRELWHASPARRRDILIAHLRLQAGSVLGFDTSRQIELDQGLFDMGMDSLMSVELKGRLERSLGVPLPSTITFNYPTIGKLADYLLNEVLREHSAPAPEETAPAPASVVSPARPTEDLSEEDLSLLLLKKLEQMK